MWVKRAIIYRPNETKKAGLIFFMMFFNISKNVMRASLYPQPILTQYSISMPPENIRFSDVFRGYRNGLLG